MPIFIGPQSSSQPRVSTPGLAYRAPLLGGEQGTAQTIALMRKLIDEACADPNFVRLAMEIVKAAPAFDEMAEAEALYNWVKRNIRFTKDPLTKEKLYRPQDLLKTRAGDCDDISMLLSALAMAVGYPMRLITVSANEAHPEEFSHVYPEAEIPPGSNVWVAMDAARVDSQFGVEPPMYFRKRAWSLTDDRYQDLSGLSGYTTVGLGQDDGSGDGIDWGGIISQSIQEIPAIISTTRGGGSTVETRYGSTGTDPYGYPYGSFQTPRTPGYGIPRAGYPSATGSFQVSGSGWMAANWPWLALGFGALLLLGGKRG